ncbi:MTG2 [Cordylochernes scorpioides]|uniref:MTG2 n=1 Tax=Cordylochernes scorpioides TaxID=51811 RepID=A0ABY6KRA4_9ARAC|nr:MTG2 [Cordylochernes scorpioides]
MGLNMWFTIAMFPILRRIPWQRSHHLVASYCSAAQEPTAMALKSIKGRSLIDRKTHMVDWCTTTVVGGKGGDGMICFLQLKSAPMLGPSGGDGGNGGHVIFEGLWIINMVCVPVSPHVRSLDHVKAVVEAEHGEKGMSKNMTGANAKHTIVEVPPGTLVKDTEGNKVRELTTKGEQFVAARGGAGGKGNAFFLSNNNRHPRVAQVGARGEVNQYSLELLLMAHAGLIGFPNAGKSTLLRAISRAKPKVATYPFTTLNPHIGVVHYDDYVQVAVADLPGILPGAHKNYGLGISFLRHVERCLCHFFVLDMSSEVYPPVGQLDSLRYEMDQYKEGLSQRPCAIIANKMDLPTSEANLEILKNSTDLPILPISGRYGKNVMELLKFLRQQYDEHNKDALVL